MARSKFSPVDYNHIADRAACMEIIVLNYIASIEAVCENKKLSDYARDVMGSLRLLHEAALAKGSENDNTLHDRAAWLCDVVSDLLVEQPEIQKDRKAHRSAHSAMCRLWTLYQHLAEKWFNKNRSLRLK